MLEIVMQTAALVFAVGFIGFYFGCLLAKLMPLRKSKPPNVS